MKSLIFKKEFTLLKTILLILLLATYRLSAQIEERKFSLYFEHDVSHLSAAHHQLLDSIKDFKNKNDLDVHIKGFANSIGGAYYNLELSRKRAESVRAQLREFTIISSDGYGELSSEAAKNRRVDILIHLKVDHVTVEGEIVEPPQVPETPQASLSTLIRPKKGDKITLQGIMFYEDRDVIMDESKEALEQLVEFLKKNPTVKFKLIGHICCGDPMKPAKDLKNVRTGKENLSEDRAKAVHNYLAKKGISTRRMRYLGMAFRQSTGKGDQFDRRVEIEITSVD
jgi:outer membrane protein OmpA-like peptidoglycan-associated protein